CRTALGVDARAGRRAGALVETVEHAIAVGVSGAALGVDARPRGRTRALVEPVVHAVAVRVSGASVRIDRGADRRVGAGIAPVARVELCADDVAEEVPQPTAAADLGVQVEDLVVTRERSERPELELVRALCGEAGAPARERYS